MRQRVMKKGLFRCILSMLVVLTMMLGIIQTASASVYVPDKKGSFTLTLKAMADGEEKLLPEVQLKLYKVGNFEYEGYGKFVLVPELADTAVDLGTLTTAEDTAQAAKTLAEAVEAAGIEAGMAVTDENGQAVFSNLEHGMYLILQGKAEEYIEVVPMLLSIPYMESAESWLYDVQAFPKAVIHDMPTSLTVTKRVYTIDEKLDTVLMPVEDETYVVGLFLDEEGTIPVNENYKKEIHLVNAATASVVYENLAEGTYYLYEIDEAGELIPLDISYENKEGETWSTSIRNEANEKTNEVVVVQPDQTEHVYFVDNYYYIFPDSYYFEGQINITKKVLIDGEEKETSDTFYAGIFRKQEDGSKKLLKVVQLEQNGTVTTTVDLNLVDGIPVDTVYEIYETDENGTPVGSSFAYKVSGEGEVILKETEPKGEITIINEKTTKEPPAVPTTVPTSIPSGGNPPGNYSEPSNPVKTGDNTPIVMFIVALAAALAAVVVIVAIKKKRSR